MSLSNKRIASSDGKDASTSSSTSSISSMFCQVLIIEDSRTQAHRIRCELQRFGLCVEVATNGNQGLDEARRLLPQVIVLDIDLPEVDGYTVCRELKKDERTVNIPVIMFTSYDSPQSTITGLQLGAIDYIPKDSFAEQNLIESLRQLGVIAQDEEVEE